jgi:SAM-dependent methyltransferase
MYKNIFNRIKYLASSFFKFIFRIGFSCPSCESNSYSHVSRKYIFTILVRCHECKLMYRVPTTSKIENNKFYQKDYTGGGQSLNNDTKNFTIDMPNHDSSHDPKNIDYKNTEKDYSNNIKVLQSLKEINKIDKVKLFDYGCSWGYGSFQIQQKGYEVTSFEISKSRANYAKTKLGVNTVDDLSLVEDESFDIFFSAHVLEHLPEPKLTIDYALRIVKKNHYLVIFVPNGSINLKKIDHYRWNQLWGLVHPNLIDEEFYKNVFNDHQYFITSSFEEDKKNLQEFKEGKNNYIGRLDMGELLIIVKKII